MREWLSSLVRRVQRRRIALLQVKGIQPLAPGLSVYAIDIDGRRIIFGATPHALCVLDRYRTPNPENRAGPADPAA